MISRSPSYVGAELLLLQFLGPLKSDGMRLSLTPSSIYYRTPKYSTGHDIHEYGVRNPADCFKNARDRSK